ncbi:MAG: SPOR domain-containing protein [Desulfobacteraceae bacterium]|jgi:cell division septation protein DedD
MARKKPRDKKEGRKIQIDLSSSSILLWGGLLLFLLVWIFALGILVGRGFFPADIQAVSELKAQIGRLQEIIRRDDSREPVAANKEPEDNPKLAFYEKLATKKNKARKEEARKKGDRLKLDRPKPVIVEASAPPKEKTPRKSPESRAEAEKKAPSQILPASPQPKPDDAMDPRVGALAAKARFTVQVAALESLGMAKDMVARLRNRGHPAYHYDVTIRGKTYYRVRCGRFLTRSDAEAYVRQLAKKEGINGFVSELE